MTKQLRVESDGDRVPKDVYLVDDEGMRVASIDGWHLSEDQMFRLAREIAFRFNEHVAATKTLVKVKEL